ncbi:MAG: OmpL47-type beta-barrel domain-containing protein, partial [Bacillota bacterium]
MKAKFIKSGLMGLGLLAVGVIYQNCAPQNLTFAPSQEELASQGRGLGANSILLNGGAQFTSDIAVTANLTYQEATHIYLTNDAGCETGGTWEEIAPTKKVILKSANALNNVYAKFKKKTGLTEFNSDCLMASITHDDIAPVVTITKKPAAITAAATAQFEMKIGDDLSGLDHFECLLVGEKDFTNCTDVKTYSNLPDGQNRFQVRAVDRAGNRSVTVEYGWVVDTAPPTIAITSQPDSTSSASSAVFNFVAADSGSGIAGTVCSLDGASFAACTSPISYSSLLEGTHSFSVQAIDNAGNKSTVATYTWKSQSSST